MELRCGPAQSFLSSQIFLKKAHENDQSCTILGNLKFWWVVFGLKDYIYINGKCLNPSLKCLNPSLKWLFFSEEVEGEIIWGLGEGVCVCGNHPFLLENSNFTGTVHCGGATNFEYIIVK